MCMYMFMCIWVSGRVGRATTRKQELHIRMREIILAYKSTEIHMRMRKRYPWTVSTVHNSINIFTGIIVRILFIISFEIFTTLIEDSFLNVALVRRWIMLCHYARRRVALEVFDKGSARSKRVMQFVKDIIRTGLTVGRHCIHKRVTRWTTFRKYRI